LGFGKFGGVENMAFGKMWLCLEKCGDMDGFGLPLLVGAWPKPVSCLVMVVYFGKNGMDGFRMDDGWYGDGWFWLLAGW